MTQEQLIAWLPIITAFLLSLPGVYAIYRQLKMERLEQKVDNLAEENRELKIVVEKQNKKIDELEIGVCTLVEQVKELGQEPRYPKEK
jgi:predicted RNase H-like nuclease (RuvC/YqgF family)